MKRLIIFLIILPSLSFAQKTIIKGKVYNLEDNSPLFLANVIVQGTSSGISTDTDGSFEIRGDFSAEIVLKISYIGFKTSTVTLKNRKGAITISVYLEKQVIPSQTVLVEAGIGEKGKTPISFSKINRRQIEEDYTTQDVPEYLSYLPSTTFYSESGNGLGYNYLSIRGFDQRRIAITVNGIPQNDPEDHNLYWIDMPDLLSNTELVQVQRGAGSGVAGYPAIGGSINIITSTFSDKPKFEIGGVLGSYQTRKFSASFASGLINNKYSIYVNLTNTISSGYRDLSWVKLKSYHVSAVRYDDKLTSQLNIYGAPIEDGLVYNGLPKKSIKNKEQRRLNYSYWEYDNHTEEFAPWSVQRRPEEIENFFQPHFELLNEVNLKNNLTLNSALFLVVGNGFFDYDGSWAIPDFGYDDYFRLKENGFDSTKTPSNMLIRAQVDNVQWGWIPRLSWQHKDGTLVLGAEYRNHRSVHWGSIGYAENLPAGVTKNYRYYYYQAGKDILNFFINENYYVTSKLNILGEFQFAYHKYQLNKEKYVGNEFTVNNFFVNPRVGINYNFNGELSTYFSYAMVSREPRLKNYYDAAESSAGEIPQFEVDDNGNYDYTKPLVKPETMNSFDLGMNYQKDQLSLSANVFYMLFDDEIVKKGQVDRFGQPVTGNVDKTVHSGIELTFDYKMDNGFELIINGSYSKNYIDKGETVLSYNKALVYLDLNGNRIAGFPDITFNGILQYKNHGLFAQFSTKYVGEFYSDNYENQIQNYLTDYPGILDYNDNTVEAYFAVNFLASYQFELLPMFNTVKVFFKANNIFDHLYAAYAIGKEFFPAAERNFLAGVRVGF